jgi:phosphate transport system protein
VDPEAYDPLVQHEAEGAGAPEGHRLDFHAALDDCDEALLAAGHAVARAIRPMTEAFLTGDGHTAAALIARDREVDQACHDLEERCFLLIARQSPVAGDLRRLVAVLKCTQDVLRSGDLLRHVGESLTWIHPPSLPATLRETVDQLGEVSHDLFTRGLTAWQRRDALAANELEQADDQVDLLQKVLLTDLYTGTQSVEEAVSLALISRYYERIADHGVEIARQATYVATGERPPAGSG